MTEPLSTRPHVFLGIPHLDTVAPEVVTSIAGATQGRCQVDVIFMADGAIDPSGQEADGVCEKLTKQVSYDTASINLMMKSASLHGQCFNSLWCEAFNAREENKYSHFVMHHSDIGADPGWLDQLCNIQRSTRADVVSCVVAIKDVKGLTSLAIASRDDAGNTRRMTMSELYATDEKGNYLLPETFDMRDLERAWNLPENSHYLYLNTGLWICDFTAQWADDFPGFNVITCIGKDAAGKKVPRGFPEDWNFSQWCQKDANLKIMATRAVKLGHYGRMRYPNTHVWGSWKTDQEGEKNQERAKAQGIEVEGGW